MRRSPLVLAGLGLLAVSCGGGAKPAASPSASPPAGTAAAPSESATPAATPSVSVGEVFYADSFRDTSKGWPTKATENAAYEYHTDYATPLYSVSARKGAVHLFPHPEFRGVTREQLTDYEVTATIQSNLSVGQGDWFGVTCRDLEGKRYSFAMGLERIGGSTVPWRIGRHDGGKLLVLAEGEHEVGGSAWDVSGACAGGTGGAATLAMKINGTLVGTATDASPLAQGYGGVYLLSEKGRTTINVLAFAARAAQAG
ncbi:MAG TPA: hypothetical protein VF519_00225 [Mycobacteriales bacterium]|jgi:hypothetical protein